MKMKLYNFTANNSFATSQPTVTKFIKAILHMQMNSKETFTGLEVMKYAMANMNWKTKNENNDKRLMETWAFYVKTLKEAGLTECGNVGNSSKVPLTIEEMMNELE